MRDVVRLGTRKSDLARVQSKVVGDCLESEGFKVEWVFIQSEGDTNLKDPLYAMPSSGPGVFTKVLEKKLLDKEIDAAVHSLKDLPTVQPDGLSVVAVSERESASDCVIYHPRLGSLQSLSDLAEGVCIGTSSLRREAMILEKNPKATLVSLRGNVPTRVQKVSEGKLDAVVLATAGINRLGLSLEGLGCLALDPTQFVPAPGQGALAVEIRTEDLNRPWAKGLSRWNNASASECTAVEREILNRMEGGCTLPLGVLCERIQTNLWKIYVFLGVKEDLPDGKRIWNRFIHFDFSAANRDTLVEKTVDHFRPFLSVRV